MTRSRSCAGPLEQVTNTFPPMMIGLARPRPGSGAVQSIFGFAGMFASATVPALSGPRNCGQSAAASELAAKAAVRKGRSIKVSG